MSAHGRHIVAALLIALVATPPGYSSTAKPLGVVLESQRATLRAAEGTPGTTVFVGDTVVTNHGGQVRVRLGAAQIEVMPESVVVFEEMDSVAGATVVQGTVSFASPETGSVAVRATGITVRPQPQRATHGQVTVVGPAELLVTSYHGPLELTLGNERLVVPEGTTYRVVQGDSRGPGPAGAGAAAVRLAPFKAFLVAFAVVAVPLVIVITHNLVASPSSIF
ncbi:MAG: hypothetical protein HY234_04745 [Acidobacteria bacterium]|nr:hypothetical protein [Acidobacteriota bacterium]